MSYTIPNVLKLQRDLTGRPVSVVTKSLDGPLVLPIDREECLDILVLQNAFKLTPRQARTVQLLYGRRTNKEIADAMGVTIFTARRHVESALSKLGTQSRFEVEVIVLSALINRTHLMSAGSELLLRESVQREALGRATAHTENQS